MRKILILALFAAALAACGTAAQEPTAGAATAQPIPPGEPSTSVPATTAPAPTAEPQPAQPTDGPAVSGPTAEPQPAAGQPRPGGGMSIRPPDELLAAAQAQIAKKLNLAPDQVVLQSANKHEWPDGALGCPEPGKAYPQIVTDGFLLVFTNPDQTISYEVHTGMGPAQMLLCQAGRPTDLSIAENPAAVASPPASSGPADDPSKQAAELARAALAQKAGVAPDQIAVVSAEPVEWQNSSLGCPKPGVAYLQVITPGFRVVLEAQGQRYEYHTDSGTRAVTCQS